MKLPITLVAFKCCEMISFLIDERENIQEKYQKRKQTKTWKES